MPKAGSLGLGFRLYRGFLVPNNIFDPEQEFVMASLINRQVRLKSRPDSVPQVGNLDIAEAAVPNHADRQFLVATNGIENCPCAVAELYRGENLGKRLIRLAV